MRSRRFWLVFLGLLVANIFVTNVLLGPPQPTSVVVPYNLFKDQVAAGNVSSVTSTGDAITGVTRTPVSGNQPGSSTRAKATNFSTQRPSFADQGLEQLLEQHKVTINAPPYNPPPPLLHTLLVTCV